MRIFGKQLLISLGVLVISIVILGVVLTSAIRTNLTEQRKATLADSAQRVSRSAEAVFLSISLREDVNFDPLITQIESVSDLMGASVVIMDMDNTILFSGLPSGTLIPTAYIETVLKCSPIVFSGSFHPNYPEPLLVAGHPIYLGDRIIGAVLVSVSMAELDATIASMRFVMSVSLIIAVIAISAIIYMHSRAITRPLRQMNEAAKVIAGGVFEKRIPVKSKDEVGQLAAQFNLMAESLHNQERVRKTFISNLSHDIRTPLTSMLGFIKAMEDGTALPEKYPYYLSVVLDEIERLIKLSNDLLDMHRIQDATLDMYNTTFNITELIQAIIIGFEQKATYKQINITSRFAPGADMVYADEDKIQRCLYNLLDNAIKFTPDVGEIVVETAVMGKKISVSVRDNGRGMALDEQQHVFDRFFKGDTSRSEDRLGSGLGLSIVKEFIHAHGEAITLESAPCKGSTFTFTLVGADL